jgi:hypothetical protein
MILTHGANSIGGCGVKIWELDIVNLSLTNHTDANGLKFSFTGITKQNDDTELKGSGNFNFTISYFDNLGKIKKMECIFTAEKPASSQYNYVGCARATFRSSGSINKYGTWCGCNNSSGKRWTYYQGNQKENYTSSGIYWNCHDGIDATFPQKNTVEFSDSEVKLFFEDTLICSKENDYNTYNWYNFTMNSGGQSTNKSIILHSLKVWYE